MKQVIDWEEIKNTSIMSPDYIFHWKYNETYRKGYFTELLLLRADNKLSEVIGFMKNIDEVYPNDDYETIINNEKIKKTELLFKAYADLDFSKLTDMINYNCKYGYTAGFNDETLDVKCSDYIDIDKLEYDMIDIQKLVKAFCDEALIRYMDSYRSYIYDDTHTFNDNDIEGEFFHNGIFIEITLDGVDISYIPLQTYKYYSNIVEN